MVYWIVYPVTWGGSDRAGSYFMHILLFLSGMIIVACWFYIWVGRCYIQEIICVFFHGLNMVITFLFLRHTCKCNPVSMLKCFNFCFFCCFLNFLLHIVRFGKLHHYLNMWVSWLNRLRMFIFIRYILEPSFFFFVLYLIVICVCQHGLDSLYLRGLSWKQAFLQCVILISSIFLRLVGFQANITCEWFIGHPSFLFCL